MAVSRINEAGLNVNQYGNRNLIINGAMNVAQRATSVASISSGGYHVCDRWTYNRDGTEVITMSQENDAPNGFHHSTKILVTTADTSLPAATQIRFETRLEAQNVRQLAYGTSDAKKITLSFYVKSNKTGSYSAGLYKDGLSGETISQGYTISASGSWEYKTLTFNADTSSGINATDNDKGLRLWFTLGANSDRTTGTANTWSTASTHRAVGQSVNLFDTTNNYWQITGVQLEVGDTATDFEHRTFADELAKCQRYFYKTQTGSGPAEYHIAVLDGASSDYINAFVKFPTSMRATPSGSQTYNGALYYNTGSGGTSFTPTGGTDGTTGFTEDYGRINQSNITNNPGTTHVQKVGQWLCAGEFDAEL